MDDHTPRRRIIVCVDGTWYDADGQEGNGQGNNSNVFRIYASIKQGKFRHNGREVEQIAEYFHGIGVKKKPLDKFNDGISGEGCKAQIQEVYQYCCKSILSPEDELWFFGFSRGAYVVRAVAGLLHHMSALSESGENEFGDDYRQALSFLSKAQQGQIDANRGKLFHFFLKKTRESPTTQFLGCFDTVKKASDSISHDLSFHDSIRHVRHAVALNEDRYHFRPELYEPIGDPNNLKGRSMIQAWFVGAHADLGGGPADDGLSLYPLQWMFFESQKHGLVFEYNTEPRFKNLIEDPLKLAFPREPTTKKYPSNEDGENPSWHFTYTNGIEVEMYDLRLSHNHGNLQKWPRKKLKKRQKPKKEKSNKRWLMVGQRRDSIIAPQDEGQTANEYLPRHMVRINQGQRPPTFKDGTRQPFRNGKLEGYCDQAGSGTIVHPSVYFVAETYPRLGIEEALANYDTDLRSFRSTNLPASNREPWMTERNFRTGEFRTFRILLCGNTGVGKSTLLNRVFGIELSPESDTTRGKHSIDEAFEYDQHPGIIIHDSEGFQAGGTNEMKAFEGFLKKRSATADQSERLHSIWICLETDTPRPVQAAEEILIKTLAQQAPGIPVVIVGTKKDRFLLVNGFGGEQLKALENIKHKDADLDLQKKAENLLSKRREIFEKAFQAVDGYGDISTKFSFVSKDDKVSIKSLMQLTLDGITDEDVYISMVAAQVADVEKKIETSIDESVRLLRHAISTAAITAVPTFGLGNSIAAPTISRLLCDNIIKCFGFPKVNAAHVDDIMSRVVWSNLGKFMAQNVGQAIGIWGGVAALTLFTGFGGIPLVAGALFLEIPPAARLVVKCACDLIIILDRAFHWGGKFVSREQIRQASLEYTTKRATGPDKEFRSRRRQVHSEIEALIPLTSGMYATASKIARLRKGMERIIHSNRFRAEESGDPRASLESATTSTEISFSSSTEEPEEIRALFGDVVTKD